MHAHVGWYRHRYLHSRSRYTYPIVFADHLWSVVFKHFCHELSFALVPNCKQDRNEATCLLPHDSYLRSTKNQYSPLLCWSEKIFWGVAAWRRSRTSPSNQEGFFFFPLSLQPFVPPCPAAASAAAACETNPTPPDSALSEQPLEPNQCTAQDTHMERQDWLVFPLESSFLIHAVGTLTSAFPRRAKLARDMAPHIARGLVLLRLDSAEMAQTKH